MDPSLSLYSSDRRFAILGTPLEVEKLRERVISSVSGACVDFIGYVRNHNHNKEVFQLEYEAYPEMVIKEFQRIELEALEKWPQCVVGIHHRFGTLQVGDIAVAIVVSTPHRKEAFEACSFLIERLKETAPIWKKETYADQSVWLGLGP